MPVAAKGKPIVVAFGADTGHLDVVSGKTGLKELHGADGRKIKMVGTQPKAVKGGGQLFFIMDKLSTAGAEGRAYCCLDMGWVREEGVSHLPNGCADNIGHTALPAAMDVGNHLPLRVME